MIIESIDARDVLKYEHLSIQNLPATGIIAISGMNESGKSTVGETICFALFGRTFSLGDKDLVKVIRWGADRCQVELDFVINGGQKLRVSRILDSELNHGAQLFDLDLSADQPIARGAWAVNDEIQRLIGFGYEEFVESFYLAQREMNTPHPHSQAVKSMAGITTYEKLSDELRITSGQVREDIESVDDDRQQAMAQLTELKIDPDQLTRLQDERQPFAEAVDDLRDQIHNIDEHLPKYTRAYDAAGRTRSGRFWVRLLALLAFIGAGALWVLWATKQGSYPWAQPLHDIAAKVPNWGGWQENLQLVAIGASVLWLLLWAWSAMLGGKLRRLSDSGAALADQVERASAWLEQAEADAAISGLGLNAAGLSATITQLRAMRLLPEQAQNELAPINEALSQDLSTFEGEVARVDDEINAEQQRLRQAGELKTMVDGLSERQAEHVQRERVMEMSMDLLNGASRHVSQRFNNHIRDEVSRTLPLFTDSRYEHLKIDESLDVRVFSSEKRDFMNLDEVSNGTQRQIMLALRLAMSQQLVDTTLQGAQFAFLDEPFAFFDQQRMTAALQALPKISADLAQIFVISQEFPEGIAFDGHVQCELDSGRLIYPAA